MSNWTQKLVSNNVTVRRKYDRDFSNSNVHLAYVEMDWATKRRKRKDGDLCFQPKSLTDLQMAEDLGVGVRDEISSKFRGKGAASFLGNQEMKKLKHGTHDSTNTSATLDMKMEFSAAHSISPPSGLAVGLVQFPMAP